MDSTHEPRRADRAAGAIAAGDWKQALLDVVRAAHRFQEDGGDAATSRGYAIELLCCAETSSGRCTCAEDLQFCRRVESYAMAMLLVAAGHDTALLVEALTLAGIHCVEAHNLFFTLVAQALTANMIYHAYFADPPGFYDMEVEDALRARGECQIADT